MPAILPTSLNCPACGAPLDYDGRSSIIKCKFCRNISVVPDPLQARAIPGGLDEIRGLVGNGDIFEAVKKYREYFGASLKEARDAVDALQAGRLAEQSEGLSVSEAPDKYSKVLEEVKRLLSQGNKIEAIKRYREAYDVSLARAKYAVEQIEAGNDLFPEAGFPAAVPISTGTTARAGRALGLAITMVILVAVAGIIAFILFLPGGPVTPRMIANGPDILIPSSAAGGVDIAGFFYNIDNSTYHVGLVNGANGKTIWLADPMPGSDYPDGIAQGNALVFAASNENLVAYRMTDGSLAWQAIMPDALNYGDNVMLVVGNRVLTTNVDQSIQAYDASTGSIKWSRRLSGYDRNLRLMNGLLVVLDYAPNSYDYSTYFLNPVDGSEQRVLTPSCQYDEYSSATLDPDSGMIYSETENSLYLVYDSSYGCIQRVDFTTGEVTWQTLSQDNYSFSPYGFNYLMSDTKLFFSMENQLLEVSRADGSVRTLVSNEDYEFVPLAPSGDTLIMRARRTRGTERFEIWGVDINTGSTAWQMDMQGASPIDPPNEMASLIDDTESGWMWKMTTPGLLLLKFQAAPNQLVLDTVDPSNGTVSSEKILSLKEVSGDFYSIPDVIGWLGDTVYLNVDTTLYGINTLTGEKIFSH